MEYTLEQLNNAVVLGQPGRQRYETLVAMDYGNRGDLVRLLERMGDAVMQTRTEQQAHWRSGEPLDVHYITFNASVLRNTHAHGMGCDCGFVVHVES